MDSGRCHIAASVSNRPTENGNETDRTENVMLYNKDWDKPEVKADPFTLPSFIAWLQKQPEDGEYRYLCSGHCLLARYFTAQGFQNVTMWTDGFWHGPERCPGSIGQDKAIAAGLMTRMPREFNLIANDSPFTFSGALTRAREALANRP